MLALCEMMVSHLVKVSQLMDNKKVSMGQVARAKAMCCALTRDVCLLAREVCGGNGIIIDNHVMK